MKLVSFLFPDLCPLCGEVIGLSEHPPFCPTCRARYEREKLSCHEAAHGQPVTRLDETAAASDPLPYLAWYDPEDEQSAVRAILLKMKHRATSASIELLAGDLADMIRREMLSSAGRRFVITYLPRSKRAIRREGFDHMKLIAKAVAKKLQIPCETYLERRPIAKEQKKLTKEGREKNARSSIVKNRRCDPRGISVILLDDIVTTGASLRAGCEALKKAGASGVYPVAFAMTKRKNEKD